jgi:Uma2 family endonuclease
MNITLREPWTIDRFLAWEDKQEGRHEFDGSRIVEMTGGSRAHRRIISNLIRLLEDALDPDLSTRSLRCASRSRAKSVTPT